MDLVARQLQNLGVRLKEDVQVCTVSYLESRVVEHILANRSRHTNMNHDLLE